ncbi:MAG: anthranilate phosphoribosyltransferase, partial [Oxalobacteraceae bacterium]
LKVSGAEESRQKVLEALDNVPGPARDIVALNAGTALYANGLAGDIGAGMATAIEAMASGAARAKMEQFVSATRKIGGA